MPWNPGKAFGSPAPETSFTGLSRDMIDAARDLADKQRVWVRYVYADAIKALIDRLDRGEAVEWTASRPGSGKKPYHVRVDVPLMERLRETCRKHSVRKSIFVLVALREHLNRNGYDFKP
jgi:hypothetical protein